MRHGIEHSYTTTINRTIRRQVKLDNPVNGDDYLDASCELLTITEWRQPSRMWACRTFAFFQRMVVMT